MAHNVSIFRQIKSIYGNGTSSFGLGVAYLYALFRKGRTAPKSNNPLVDEGMDVYKGLKKINGRTFGLNEKMYLKNVEQLYNEKVSAGTNNVKEGTVEKLIMSYLAKEDNDVHDVASKLGKMLKNVVIHKPSYGVLIENIAAGTIQRIEQKIILRDLEKLLA